MQVLGRTLQFHKLVSTLLFLACLGHGFALQAQEDDETVFRPSRPGEETEFNVENGLLIVNGQFLPPPYHILTLPSGEVEVNGHKIDFKQNTRPKKQFIAARSRNIEGRGRRGYASRREYLEGAGEFEDREYNEDTLGSFLYGVLLLRGVVVSQSGESPYWIGASSGVLDFLNAALSDDSDVSSLPPWLASNLPALRADPEFRKHALEYVRAAEKIEIENRKDNGKVRLLDRAAYPLSSVGMLLVVLATGQLLSVRPPKRDELHLVSDEASTNTVRFAAMIVGFSVLDLVWTLLASHDGTMKELNPLGAKLITDPMMLVAFKLATTSVSVGILIYLRQHHRITLASWWLCLVLTLLTARWLTFNSLLV